MKTRNLVIYGFLLVVLVVIVVCASGTYDTIDARRIPWPSLPYQDTATPNIQPISPTLTPVMMTITK
jgi:hypothetical protein